LSRLKPQCDNYILQRLNSNVFKNIPNLQENMERVTAHLAGKIAAIPGSDVKRECLTLIPDRETGRSFITDDEGRYWRMFIFISDHRSYERVDSRHKAFEGGRIIGRFQACLPTCPANPCMRQYLTSIISQSDWTPFHDVISQGSRRKGGISQSEIEEITSREEEMKTILRLGAEGKFRSE
jgi:hypothetical protein